MPAAEQCVTPRADTSSDALRAQRASFTDRGFAIVDALVPAAQCAVLTQQLDAVLRGEYDLGRPPDKWPNGASRAGGQTLQIVNIFKADRAFAALATSAHIGQLVASLAGWRGARLVQDQVWYKPPGAGPLVFHRDSTYFEDYFEATVVTVWVALDPMTQEVGPLEYASGSHRWGDEHLGLTKQFFDTDRRAMLDDAARREGLGPNEVAIVPVIVERGGAGLHDGRTWHGSGPNHSADQPRRGVGLHYIPAECVTFKPGASMGRMWRKYLAPDGSSSLPEAHFPVVGGGSTPPD
mmetsp:Transcript_47772/g.109946  ORF Transcript_47772/g.109946 Transcript_47772/m.109946 type:complete len:294 (+) Transcript_47772:99-980(+)